MRLINADKLKDIISDTWVLDRIDEQPTVDVDNLNAKHENIGYEKGYRDGYAEALEVIDADKRYGHWVENDTTYAEVTRQTCTCSVCGKPSPRPLGEFCRWCGAKMCNDNN